MCECIETVNEKLLEAGHNTKIKMPMLMLSGTARPRVVTEKSDTDVRKRPIDVFASFCPFCGVALNT